MWKDCENKKSLLFCLKSMSSVHFFWKGRGELDIEESLIGRGRKTARISAREDWQRKNIMLFMMFDIMILADNFKIPVCRVQFSLSFRAVWILNTCTSVISFAFFSPLEIRDWYQTKFHSVELSWAFLFLTKLLKLPLKQKIIYFILSKIWLESTVDVDFLGCRYIFVDSRSFLQFVTAGIVSW